MGKVEEKREGGKEREGEGDRARRKTNHRKINPALKRLGVVISRITTVFG